MYETVCNIYGNNDQFKPEWFIEKYCKNLDLPFEAEKIAHQILRNFKTAELFEEKEAYTVATLAVFLTRYLLEKDLLIRNEYRKSIVVTISDITGTSVITLKNLYNKCKQNLNQIIPFHCKVSLVSDIKFNKRIKQ